MLKKDLLKLVMDLATTANDLQLSLVNVAMERGCEIDEKAVGDFWECMEQLPEGMRESVVN